MTREQRRAEAKAKEEKMFNRLAEIGRPLVTVRPKKRIKPIKVKRFARERRQQRSAEIGHAARVARIKEASKGI